MTKQSPVNRLKGFFRISPKEAGAILEHMRSAWRHEELIPQPEGYILIPLERIKPPTNAIREELGDLEELKESIKRSGQLQSIGVVPTDRQWRQFEVVMGLRRYFACRELELKHVRCFITPHVDREKLALYALEENNFRKSLTPPELLKGMLILKGKGYTNEQLGKLAGGMSRNDVSIYLKIQELPKQVRDAFLHGRISIGHLRLLVKFEPEKTVELVEEVIERNLSVKALSDLLAVQEGELELPDFLAQKGVKELLGSKLVFRRGRKGVTLRIRATDEEELRKILSKLSR